MPNTHDGILINAAKKHSNHKITLDTEISFPSISITEDVTKKEVTLTITVVISDASIVSIFDVDGMTDDKQIFIKRNLDKLTIHTSPKVILQGRGPHGGFGDVDVNFGVQSNGGKVGGPGVFIKNDHQRQR